MNSFERCALSGPQKHITKESDGFHNHSTQLTMMRTVFVCHIRYGGSYKLGNLVKVVAGSFQNSHQLNMASTFYILLIFV